MPSDQSPTLTRDQLIAVATNGLTQADAARKLGVSQSKISRICSQEGIVWKELRPRGLTAPQKKIARRKHQLGATLRELADEFGVSHQTIQKTVSAVP
ncbi:MAG: hypothetical protein O3A46_00895 [Candidatus Poribacteria bacterium]|nr:hypothetical protein [Candidatus Poribacteria bacterium]